MVSKREKVSRWEEGERVRVRGASSFGLETKRSVRAEARTLSRLVICTGTNFDTTSRQILRRMALISVLP